VRGAKLPIAPTTCSNQPAGAICMYLRSPQSTVDRMWDGRCNFLSPDPRQRQFKRGFAHGLLGGRGFVLTRLRGSIIGSCCSPRLCFLADSIPFGSKSLRLNPHSGFSTNRRIGNAPASGHFGVPPELLSPEHCRYSPNYLSTVIARSRDI
jgi:hypothetical protein